MTAASSSSDSKSPKVFAPSRFVVDNTNGSAKKYRLCAAAAVLNSQGHLLVGERTSIANAWQAPQGGVDAAWEENQFQEETIVQAASRELYEEMGLVVGKHVVVASEQNDNNGIGIRYETSGTQNWLTKAGFAGQELHCVVFRCIDGRGDADASLICDLTGQNGEAPEFRQVAWRSITDVLTDMWPAKRGPYEALQSLLSGGYEKSWKQQCQQTIQDFAGTWSRDAELSQNLQAALMARGLTPEKALESSKSPYKQTWSCNNDSSNNNDFPEWTVTTYGDDGVTPRRTLLYPIGEWEESYQGASTLFGESLGSKPATLKRRTFYAPQSLGEDKRPTVAHVTVSQTPKGDTEESRRYREGDHFMLQRIFSAEGSLDDAKKVISVEVFVRDE